ncbi:hypothetical protein [Shewanella sp.]|uniref:hypothetical protein n=1 Tax=Shewanella sp. TaxID=50422 RepID=UPI001ED7A111|nr:hypothetical protein [Shewanella sp.]NRB25790.1 hypothetical protein [Shewanella sp.]
MNSLLKSIFSVFILLPGLAFAVEHNHNHNHFNPKLELLANDIIGITVCYNNGFISDQQQEPAFVNLIEYTGVTGAELGMYYMNSLGKKAEQIMSDPDSSLLWHEAYCENLAANYLDLDELHDRAEQALATQGHHRTVLSPEIVKQDIERGRLLTIQ